jgi:predicted permease
MINCQIIFFSSVVILLSISSPAYAYLDAGSGSYILQLIIGGVAAALFSIKIYWRKIKQFYIQTFRKEDNDII